jgi:hypothetical protein
MLRLLQKDMPSVGGVLFRGTLPGRPEEFSFLEKAGIRITPGATGPAVHWSLRLEHPSWGSAELTAPREAPLPPRALIDMSFSLDPQDRAQAAAAGHVLALRADAKRKNVLRDRKNFLRFARAVMDDDGLAVFDHSSLHVWSPAALDDELAHDADLDIVAVHCLHAVHAEGRSEQVNWLHSHGLAELGAFDFDILLPGEDILTRATDGLRALAFAIVEGAVGPSTSRFVLARPGGEVRLVPVEEFNRKAPAAQRALRDADGPEHNPPRGSPRSVVCDPATRVGGLLGASVRFSRFLSGPIPEGVVFVFTTAATELMADRARRTIDIFGSLLVEFADLGLPCLAKIGFAIAEGGGGQEHIWFHVHAIRGDGIDGTCLNEPFDVPGLHEGQRGTHSARNLTDWLILTPLGQITPRSLGIARQVRARPEEVARAVQEKRSA